MRFFFNIRDKLRIEDELGREFEVASEAVVFAKHLAEHSLPSVRRSQ